MSDQPIDADLKRRVLDALIAAESADLEANAEDVTDEHDASEVITDDTTSFDDKAQSSEELGIAAPLEEAAAQEEANRRRVANLDPGPTDRVGVGALVGFGGDRFVAGVVAEPFDCDGVTYEGLSADSPLYAVIEGLRAGDSFSFRGTEHRLDFVI